MNKSKILWFDTETTGLDPVKNDIIQIAGIVEIDGEVVETFEYKCAPFNSENIEQQALDVHGFTKEQILEWDNPKNVYQHISHILSNHVNKFDRSDKFIPAGHNVGFDVGFLKNFFLKSGDKYFGSFFTYHSLDTLALSITLDYLGAIKKPENYKLETLAKLFGIEINAHDALSDISATRDLFLKLTSLIKGDK